MDLFFMQLFNALSVSSILLLASLGLAITFGLMGVINMAHGEFIMIGAYATYVVQNIWKQIFPEAMFDWYFPAAILVSFLFTALLGVLLERVIICRLYGHWTVFWSPGGSALCCSSWFGPSSGRPM